MSYFNKNYNNLPKKPVKSFMDLEVYQKALEANVFISNVLIKKYSESVIEEQKKQSNVGKGKRNAPHPPLNIRGGAPSLFQRESRGELNEIIIKTMFNCTCSIPHLIAEAHSCRFGSQQTCLVLLEKAMLNCNKMMVYLEQTRDICETGLEWEKFDETIKKYMYLRRKVLNLQRSWKKYMSADGSPINK